MITPNKKQWKQNEMLGRKKTSVIIRKIECLAYFNFYHNVELVFSDQDLERLYDQWEEGDEPVPLDELPEWDPRKPKPGLDLSDMSKYKEPEDFLRASKKGQSIMMFVKVSGDPTRKEAEEMSGIWQTGLWNTHIHVDRFMIEDDRAIFMFKVCAFDI
jgi:hypothetical protein